MVLYMLGRYVENSVCCKVWLKLGVLVGSVIGKASNLEKPVPIIPAGSVP